MENLVSENCKGYAYSKVAERVVDPGIYLLGFEFDGTVCFRKGASLGPNAFRKVSEGIESFSPYQGIDLEDANDVFDLGNLFKENEKELNSNFEKSLDRFNDIFKGKNLKDERIKLVTLGGEHSISIAPINKYLNDYDDLLIIHLDAHADLRDGYLGFHYSHASIMRRALDLFTPSNDLIQYGIRSGTKEEYELMREKKTLCLSRFEFLEKVKNIPKNRPVYLTLDLDFFDPAFLPGTGTPEPGGEDFHCFISLMKVLSEKNFVGADIVELAPEIDSTENSSVFGTKVLREIICTLKKCGQQGV